MNRTAIIALAVFILWASNGSSCLAEQSESPESYRLELGEKVCSVALAPDARWVCFLTFSGELGVLDGQTGRLAWKKSITEDPLSYEKFSHLFAGVCAISSKEPAYVFARYYGNNQIVKLRASDGEIVPDFSAKVMRFDFKQRFYATLGVAIELNVMDIPENPASPKEGLARALDFLKSVYYARKSGEQPSEEAERFWKQLEDKYGEYINLPDVVVKDKYFRAIWRVAENRVRDKFSKDVELRKKLTDNLFSFEDSKQLKCVNYMGAESLVVGVVGIGKTRDMRDFLLYNFETGQVETFFGGRSVREFPNKTRFMETAQLELIPSDERKRAIHADIKGYWAMSQSNNPVFVVAGWETGTYSSLQYHQIDWVMVGSVGKDGSEDWRIFKTEGALACNALGADAVICLYESGKVRVWDISGQGPDPILKAEKQLTSDTNDKDVRIVVGKGTAVITIDDDYWWYHKGKFFGPRKTAGSITSMDVGFPYIAYGTESGALILEKLSP